MSTKWLNDKSFLWLTLIFLVAGVSVHIFYNQKIDKNRVFNVTLQKRLNKTFQKIENDQQYLSEYLRESGDINFSELKETFEFPIYIYKNGTLEFWSTNKIVPDDSVIQADKKYIYHSSGIHGNIYVKSNPVIRDTNYRIISLVPIESHYDISNQFLVSGINENYFKNQEVNIIGNEAVYSVYAPNKSFLFGILTRESVDQGNNYWTATVLILLSFGIVCWVVFLCLYYRRFVKKGAYVKGVVFLLLSFALTRLILLYLKFPFGYFDLDLFDSRHYASSLLNPSLGDLLINIGLLLVFVILAFISYPNREIIKLKQKRGKDVLPVQIILSLGVILSILFIYKLIYSLGTHSQWPIEISSNANFSVFSIFSYILFILSGIIFILVNYFGMKLWLSHLKTDRNFTLVSFLISGFLFLISGIYTSQNLVWVVLLAAGYLSAVRLIKIENILVKIQYKTFVFILFSIAIISISGAKAIYDVGFNNDIASKEHFGNQLLQENDPLTEFFLSEAKTQITSDVFIKNRLFSPFGSKDIIEEKIRQVYLNSYLDRYEIDILLFNSRGDPINSNANVSFHELKERFGKDQFMTEYEGLYFYSNAKDINTQRYLEFLSLQQYGTEIGYIILNLTLKKIIPTKVYPRLLLDERFSSNYYADQFDYALFSQFSLVNSSGEFNYAKYFSKDVLESHPPDARGFKMKGFHHLVFSSATGNTYIISSPTYSFKYFVSNFSFLFILLTFFFLIILLGYTFYYYMTGKVLNFATKIQLFLNFAFFIPLLVISISSLTRTTRDIQDQVENNYVRTAKSASFNLTPYLDSFIKNNSGFEELSSKLSELAGFGDIDINIYNVAQNRGKLLVTTQPSIFQKQLISEFVNPEAISSLMEDGVQIEIVDESFGKLNYKTAYVGIRSFDQGELIGILSIPFLGSQELINKNRTGYISSILVIFTVIFIGFVLLSYFLSRYLTVPLELLTDRLRKTTLSGSNEPLKYDIQDEIGQLVFEYNNMLLKFENSKKALAQSQKEAAWREMAKQVAHEIKNPLTPMKLTLQHLQIRLSELKDESKDRYEKLINSLLHNIETLSDIATSFSNYAQMPIPETEKFDFVGLLKQSINIYINNKEIDFKIEIPNNSLYVQGDPNWIGRAISNLIINGIQAVEEGKRPSILVSLNSDTNSKVLLTIKDNGKGIPEELSEKVFMPNFSTKYTGSGIGLAISKRAVEHAGGKIWYTTEVKKGTIFFVEIPLVK